MKRRFPYLLTMLLVTALFLTLCAWRGQKTLYRAYAHDVKRSPLLSLALQGIREEVSPLIALTAPLPPEEAPRATSLSDYPNLRAGGDALSAPPAEEEAAEDAEETPVDTPPENKAPAEEPVAETTGEDASPLSAGETPADDGDVQQAADGTAQGTPLDDAYYADALFIGDSRTVGLSQYCPGLDAYATFYCQVSLTIYNALSAQLAADEDGMAVSAEEALSMYRFGKIYLMIGINEIGTSTADFIATYAAVVEKIRALQPEAVIYIQSIMHVSAGKEREAPLFSNATVNERNAYLAAMANGADIVYIDINYLIDDEGGALNAAYTFDGVHLTAGAYDLWYQAIRAQTR